jgi:hypothetical protein
MGLPLFFEELSKNYGGASLLVEKIRKSGLEYHREYHPGGAQKGPPPTIEANRAQEVRLGHDIRMFLKAQIFRETTGGASLLVEKIRKSDLEYHPEKEQ